MFHCIVCSSLEQIGSRSLCDHTTGLRKKSRAKDPRCFLLDTVPTSDDKLLTGAKLPTRRQGHLTTGCISIQQLLGRALLWCACRKHIGEIVLTKVWESLKIEVSASKDIIIFQRFRDRFSTLKYDDSTTYTYADPASDVFLLEQRKTVCDLLQTLRQEKFNNLVRADCKELLDLTLLYITGECPEGFSLCKPGATHRARWMGKLLYALKMVLLEKSIQKSPGICTQHQAAKLTVLSHL